jgi:hypothetical protein
VPARLSRPSAAINIDSFFMASSVNSAADSLLTEVRPVVVCRFVLESMISS